jgi:metal-sulfur cluster biosynthetic enzyme
LASKIISALKNVDDYEIKASNAGQFEEIIMRNPSCFIVAMNKLTKSQCEQAASVFINETFYYPRDDIKQALNSVKPYRLSCLAS